VDERRRVDGHPGLPRRGDLRRAGGGVPIRGRERRDHLHRRARPGQLPLRLSAARRRQLRGGPALHLRRHHPDRRVRPRPALRRCAVRHRRHAVRHRLSRAPRVVGGHRALPGRPEPHLQRVPRHDAQLHAQRRQPDRPAPRRHRIRRRERGERHHLLLRRAGRGQHHARWRPGGRQRGAESRDALRHAGRSRRRGDRHLH
jgi:hypothetical protein